MTPVHNRLKTPWLFRVLGWIATRFSVEIYFQRNTPELEWNLVARKRRQK